MRFFILLYSSHSDDNLLRNIELFDKLSLRFNGRVRFVKDVIGSNEICCWSFYGHGSKIAEVCCTSIVYGTDKKHTKVIFLKTGLDIVFAPLFQWFFQNADVNVLALHINQWQGNIETFSSRASLRKGKWEHNPCHFHVIIHVIWFLETN